MYASRQTILKIHAIMKDSGLNEEYRKIHSKVQINQNGEPVNHINQRIT